MYKVLRYNKIFPVRIIVAVMLCICMIACSRDREDMSGNDEVTYVITTKAGALADANKLNESEWLIKRLRLIVCNGSNIEKNLFIDNITSDNHGVYTVTTTIRKSPTKTIYAIVNESNEMTISLAHLISIDDLKKVKYNLSDYVSHGYISTATTPATYAEYIYGDNSSYSLPMYGKSEISDASTDANVSVDIGVDRAVARIDLFFKGTPATTAFNANTTVSLKNSSTSGFLTPDNMCSSLSGGSYVATFPVTIPKNILFDTITYKQVFSIYVPEQDCSSDKLCIMLQNIYFAYAGTGSEKGYRTFEIPLNQVFTTGSGISSNVNKIERNHVYRINCMIKDWDIKFTQDVIDWNRLVYDIVLVGT